MQHNMKCIMPELNRELRDIHGKQSLLFEPYSYTVRCAFAYLTCSALPRFIFDT